MNERITGQVDQQEFKENLENWSQNVSYDYDT